ncbi:nischarin-like isoform X3 [Canis lupus familiaris]|uniref:nischarin-like isoform X3 n=1 Tax=Canis lupus familiaris TaxID=9615 RepID=UPI00005A30C0|nr:nischarin-like isoform X3 [Canis lupus familiaris]|eukprot:XP_022259646.1 nischarin-like [Canis lupus familiaris]
MPAAESKPMHIVVTLLIHFPDLDESPVPLATPEEQEAPLPAMEVPDINIQPLASGEQRPSVPKQHPEPCQETTPAPKVGPDEASGPEVVEQVTAAGAECLAQAEMPAAECKPMHVVVTPLIHCPDLEEPPVPLDAPEEEQALGPAIRVQEVLERPTDSVEQPASATEQHPEPPQEPTQAPTSGPAEAYGPEPFEPGTAVGAKYLA